jgi:hypothetical protein
MNWVERIEEDWVEHFDSRNHNVIPCWQWVIDTISLLYIIFITLIPRCYCVSAHRIVQNSRRDSNFIKLISFWIQLFNLKLRQMLKKSLHFEWFIHGEIEYLNWKFKFLIGDFKVHCKWHNMKAKLVARISGSSSSFGRISSFFELAFSNSFWQPI